MKSRAVYLVLLLGLLACHPQSARSGAPVVALGDGDKAIQPFLKEYCVHCHGEKKQKGAFRVDTLSWDFKGGGSAGHWADVMDRISSGEMPPEDEPRAKIDQSTKVVEWLAGKIKEGESARLASRERVTFHRLTREEYTNTVHDLLGVNYDPYDPTGLAEDQEWHGFERIGSVLSLSPSHVEKYFNAAENVLSEALPVASTPKIIKRNNAIELRGGPDRARMIEQGIADKVRVELWPGAELQGAGRIGPGKIPVTGDYKVRIQLSGLQPKDGRAPHLAFYALDLDRLLFEQDIVAPEDKPVVIEFRTHLPAGSHDYRLSNAVPGPPNTPRSGRADPRLPFLSIKDGRRPWQIKLSDEEGQAIRPFLILDWIEWEGPLTSEGPTYAQREYLPKASGDLASARQSLRAFAERAFRRPVQAAEVEQFGKLVESEMKSGEKFDAATRTAMLAILCSKDFLYLVEGSAERTDNRINDWELASRLSYFLWSTMPDAALMDAARSGKLHEPSVLRAQVDRMLADPQAKRFTEAFPRQWLQLKRVGMFPPDKKLYPDYDPYLEKSMIGETTAYFREMLEKNFSLKEFLESNWTMLNARLAYHYQIPYVTEDRFQRAMLQTRDHRGGLLTQAAILSLTSDGTRHRPVHRGKWVMESILGKSPPPPPANVKAIEPTAPAAPKSTLRMKLAAHTTDVTCAACHRKIDPLGLAFDNYDAIGRWRTEEVVSDGSGDNPKVDASGELIDGRKFNDAVGLKKLLVADLDKFNSAFIEKLATFALRRTMTLDDRIDLANIARQSKAADYRLATIVQSLVLSDLFQKR